MSDLYTPRQAAVLLGVSAASVCRLIRLDRLEARAIGRTYQISQAAIDRYLLENSDNPAVQRAIFARLDHVAQRNPTVDGDALLHELEADDERGRRVLAG